MPRGCYPIRISAKCLDSGAQPMQQGSISDLNLAICLGVSNGRKAVLYVKLTAQVLESAPSELCPIVRDNDAWDLELVYHVFQYELSSHLISDRGNSFCLHPLGKIVNNDKQKTTLCRCHRKGSQYIHLALHEEPRGKDGDHLCWVMSWILLK